MPKTTKQYAWDLGEEVTVTKISVSYQDILDKQL